MKFIIAAFAVTLSFMSQARAGVLIEPYLGYQSMLTTFTFGSSSGINGMTAGIDASGIGFGGRIGLTLPMFFVAADYGSASPKSKAKDLPAGVTFSDQNLTRTSLGVTAGLNFPMFRPYLGYILDDQVKSDTSTSLGSGFKVGIGFSILPMLKLNAEYQMMTYTKSKDSTGETTYSSSGFFSGEKSAGFFIGLSAPFTL